MNQLYKLPLDVRKRIEELTSLDVQMPVIFASIDISMAEFCNQYSDGWVEVFILHNNEFGEHYFFTEEISK